VLLPDYRYRRSQRHGNHEHSAITGGLRGGRTRCVDISEFANPCSQELDRVQAKFDAILEAQVGAGPSAPSDGVFDA
jgi:hypothetical protein